jgi:hypothetical protein
MDGLRYRDTVPLRWRLVDELPQGPELARVLKGNEQLLQLLPSLEAPAEHAYDDEPPSRYMQMLELRLRLLTELLADLLVQTQSLPPEHPVELSVNELDWLDEDPPAVSSAVMVEIYLSPSMPRPLRLPGVVASVSTEQGGQWVNCRLQIRNEAMAAELEKLIFRQHRRMVASQRRPNS